MEPDVGSQWHSYDLVLHQQVARVLCSLPQGQLIYLSILLFLYPALRDRLFFGKMERKNINRGFKQLRVWNNSRLNLYSIIPTFQYSRIPMYYPVELLVISGFL